MIRLFSLKLFIMIKIFLNVLLLNLQINIFLIFSEPYAKQSPEITILLSIVEEYTVIINENA